MASKESVVKIFFPSEHINKVIKLDLSLTAHDAKFAIFEKRQKTVPIPHLTSGSGITIEDYGLYAPPTQTLLGEWMDDNTVVNEYLIEQRGCIEFRLKSRPLTIFYYSSNNFTETTAKTQIFEEVDFTAPVANLIRRFFKYFSTQYPIIQGKGSNLVVDEYVLCFPTPTSKPLESKLSLFEQHVPFNATVHMKLKGDLQNKGTISNSTMRSNTTNTNNTVTNSNKSQQSSSSKTRIFGVPISEVLNRKHREYPIIPVILSIIEFIEKHGLQSEGIFRLSGSQPDILKIKKEIDSLEIDSDQVSLIEKCKDVHVVAGLLKLYLRELPGSLLGGEKEELYEAIIACNSCSDSQAKAHFLTSVLNELSEDHKFLFGRILDLLAYIVDPANQSHNKMSIQNLSTCLGPNLLYKSNSGEQIDVMGTATANSVIYNILSFGIYFNPPQSCFVNPDSSFTNTYLFISLAKAIYPFSSENPQELSFHEGDIILVISESESGWWFGASTIDGKFGLFPNNYVEIISMFKDKNQQTESENAPPSPPIEPTQQKVSKSNSSSTSSTNPSNTTSSTAANANNNSAITSSKGKFQTELEILKKHYEQEKQSRIELEKLAKTMMASIESLQQQVKVLTETNQQLMKACNIPFTNIS